MGTADDMDDPAVSVLNSNILKIPDDQLKFLVCQLTALLLGFPFRTVFSDKNVSPLVRHLLEIVTGVTMVIYCFGSGTLHIVAQSLVCYVLMVVLPPRWKGVGVFVTSLGYMCGTHIQRQYYDYGGYTLDVTGPLMVVTQRLSSLAFSLQDGAETDTSRLSPHKRRYAVSSVPNPVHFLSYVFCFHTLMCGPFCFYNDYIAFINGTCFKKEEHCNGNTPKQGDIARPSPLMPMLSSLGQAVVCGFVLSTWVPLWPASYLEEAEFLETSFLSKMFSILMVTSMARFKYYFAWKLGETVNLSCGFGFNGYDSSGNAKWDLISMVDIIGFEVSLNMKMLLDSWNKSTNAWLRYTVYERVDSMAAVFMVSAFWHGFYPGYYILFVSAALVTQASRLLRRRVRDKFQHTKVMSIFYDVLTSAVTRVVIAYITFPFVLLNFWSSIVVYKSIYFWVHALNILVIVLLPIVMPQKRRKKLE